MFKIASALAVLSIQSTYGPPVPPAPPQTTVPPSTNDRAATDFEALLRAQGLSDAGLIALRGIPIPLVAKGATRAAQCVVEQLSQRDPVPVEDLASALEERDATAAAQAQATTRYLVAALGRLGSTDRRVLLAIVGTQSSVGGSPPPRPIGQGRIAEMRGRPGPDGPARGFPPDDRGRPGDGSGNRPEESRSPHAAAAPLFSARQPRPVSVCEQVLGG